MMRRREKQASSLQCLSLSARQPCSIRESTSSPRISKPILLRTLRNALFTGTTCHALPILDAVIRRSAAFRSSSETPASFPAALRSFMTEMPAEAAMWLRNNQASWIRASRMRRSFEIHEAAIDLEVLFAVEICPACPGRHSSHLALPAADGGDVLQCKLCQLLVGHPPPSLASPPPSSSTRPAPVLLRFSRRAMASDTSSALSFASRSGWMMNLSF